MIDESRKIGTFGHGYTYRGHPVAPRSRVKALEIYQRATSSAKCAALAPRFRRASRGWRASAGRRGAGLGLMGGIELCANKASKRSFEARKAVGARLRAPRRAGRCDRPFGDGRRIVASAAARHQPSRDRRAFQPPRGARSTRRSIGSRGSAWRRADANKDDDVMVPLPAIPFTTRALWSKPP